MHGLPAFHRQPISPKPQRLAMPKGAWRPERRLLCKTTPPRGHTAKRSKMARALCVDNGTVPKARRAFAIFVAERGTARRGDTREAHAGELKRLGKLWKQLPDTEKAPYKDRSVAEFAAQRAALLRHGTLPRVPRASENAQQPSKEVPSTGLVSIGPYTVAKHAASSSPATILGQGSYGKVLAATCQFGRRCAVKYFSGRDANIEASQEIAHYQLFASLKPAERSWYPLLLDSKANGLPWPWMALSLGSPSLDDCLRSSGPLPTSSAIVFGAQLQRALRVLHSCCIST